MGGHQALDTQDPEVVRITAHDMKGSGGSYGFDRITEFDAAIELAAKSADAVVIGQAPTSLAAYLEEVTVNYE